MAVDATNLYDLFSERVDRASLGIPISKEVRVYLTSLLMESLRADRRTFEDQTMAELYIRADTAPVQRKASIFRELGDRNLILLGVFGASVNRKVVNESYYVGMGSAAYYRTHLWYAAAFGTTFKEMAMQFEDCVAVIELSMGL